MGVGVAPKLVGVGTQSVTEWTGNPGGTGVHGSSAFAELDACQAAAAALTEIPTRFRTGLTRRRAVELYRSIPVTLHTTAEARALAHTLAA
jgi:hypothetical protein